MTEESQLIAIAEALDITPGADGWDSLAITRLPDWLTDLNACHEMEKVLTADECYAFEDGLRAVPSSINCAAENRIWHSTAAQRCEAFLRTKGLWRDE
jgi:hypothetical protein